MSRAGKTVILYRESVPRASGDEPGFEQTKNIDVECSPRERG